MLWSRSTVGLILFAITLQLGCQTEPAYQAPPPPKVTVVEPIVQTVPIFLEENGQTEAVEQAIVQARVRGILGKLLVDPESDNLVVKDETILFEIQPEEYEAALASADAEVNSAKAELVSAEAAIGVDEANIEAANALIAVNQAESDRMDGLIGSRAVSQSEYDAAKAQLTTSKAALSGAQAKLETTKAQIATAKAKVNRAIADREQAKLDLEWTTVKAPINGRITKALVKEGNLVEDGTALIEIIKNDPIWANFSINESFLLYMERHSTRKNSLSDLSKIKVQLKRSGDVGFPFEGHLDYIDPKVDQDTGTLQLRAVFDNAPGDSNLLPGLFVRVRVQIGQFENALLIPERAIGRDQVGAFVYVVGPESKALRKPVVLGKKYNNMMVIESGIEPNDSVIVDGIQRVRPDVEVDPTKIENDDRS